MKGNHKSQRLKTEDMEHEEKSSAESRAAETAWSDLNCQKSHSQNHGNFTPKTGILTVPSLQRPNILIRDYKR